MNWYTITIFNKLVHSISTKKYKAFIFIFLCSNHNQNGKRKRTQKKRSQITRQINIHGSNATYSFF